MVCELPGWMLENRSWWLVSEHHGWPVEALGVARRVTVGGRIRLRRLSWSGMAITDSGIACYERFHLRTTGLAIFRLSYPGDIGTSSLSLRG